MRSGRGLHIRTASAADAEAITDLHLTSMREADRLLFPAASPARIEARDQIERWREYLIRGASVTLLAVADGEPVGFVDFGMCRDRDVSPGTVGMVTAIFVHPAQWGRGVGSLLMRAALDRLRRDGFAEVVLWVIEGNRRAIEFYERFGFVRDGSLHHSEMYGVPATIVRLRSRPGTTTNDPAVRRPRP